MMTSAPARATPRVTAALVASLMALTLLPGAVAAAEARERHPRYAAHRAAVAAAQKAAERAEKAHRRAVRAQREARERAHRRAVRRAKELREARIRAAKIRARILGVPPKRYVVPPGSYFSYPNLSRADSVAIRRRVLLTIQSTWGGRRTRLGPLPTNGRIRMATWSFDDWDVAKALYAAYKRGVSVQVMAADTANDEDHPAWHWLRRRLGQRLYRPGLVASAPMASFARQCRGACRGYGGTPHSKYFLFDNVGPRHARNVVVQTSMNLTWMAYAHQWNQAQVVHSKAVYDDFARIFAQTKYGRPQRQPYHVFPTGNVVNIFFPRPGARAEGDPVMQILDRVACSGATHFGTARGHTKIRVNQYAIYGHRGEWIARKLRYLWSRGCDVAIIYSISSRPVLDILRSGSGRGPIPMRQSVVKDYWGNLVTYNHSKWMTITGRWGDSTQANVTFNGSANWSDMAFGDDEQMQRIIGRRTAVAHLANFAKTWRQGSSRPPSYGRVTVFGRTGIDLHLDVPEVAPAFGRGVFRYAEED